jgi:hypothetical protein
MEEGGDCGMDVGKMGMIMSKNGQIGLAALQSAFFEDCAVAARDSWINEIT